MGVLSDTVQDIVANQGYLTEKDLRDLAALIPRSAVNEGSPDSEIPLLDTMMRRMFRLVERMHEQLLSSTTADPSDHRQVITATKNLMEMMIKNAEKIDHQKRAVDVENAIVAALDEVAETHDLPILKETYLRALERSLAATAEQES